MQIADVLMPLALDAAYSYAVPDAMQLCEGDVVQVPLGTRETVGVVWALREGAGGNLKMITAAVDTPNLTPGLRRLLDWVAWYTLAPKGSALTLGLRLPDGPRPESIRVGVRLAGPAPKRITPARGRVIELAQDGLVRTKRELAQGAAVSVAVGGWAHRRGHARHRGAAAETGLPEDARPRSRRGRLSDAAARAAAAALAAHRRRGRAPR
jgi:primosomal protein N' (replication factor Y)